MKTKQTYVFTHLPKKTSTKRRMSAEQARTLNNQLRKFDVAWRKE